MSSLLSLNGGILMEILPLKKHLAFARPGDGGEQAQQRCLAGAIGAIEQHGVAPLDVLSRLIPAVTFL